MGVRGRAGGGDGCAGRGRHRRGARERRSARGPGGGAPRLVAAGAPPAARRVCGAAARRRVARGDRRRARAGGARGEPRLGHPALAPVAALALGVALAFAPGCASLRWSLQKWLRSAGTANLAFPEPVFEQYGCGARSLPFLAIELDELVPPRVRPGGEFNHRMVYALCPAAPTEVVTGLLHTRIRFRGEPLYDESGTYELRPGRWRVDAIVEIPPDAEAGVYAYEISFAAPQLSFERSLTFLIEEP
jgi:hypothetical protein